MSIIHFDNICFPFLSLILYSPTRILAFLNNNLSISFFTLVLDLFTDLYVHMHVCVGACMDTHASHVCMWSSLVGRSIFFLYHVAFQILTQWSGLAASSYLHLLVQLTTLLCFQLPFLLQIPCMSQAIQCLSF